jgi:ABC-2 type transport system permease protein
MIFAKKQPTDGQLFAPPSRFYAPGSALWLMFHHIRTRLRGKVATNRVQSTVRNLLLIGLLVFAVTQIGKNVADALVVLDGNYEYTPYLRKAGIMMSAFVISLLGSSLISAYSIFTDRDDLDLLLASPLPPQRILMARLLQSTYSAFFTAFIMGSIALGYSIVTVDLRFVFIYPILFSFMILDLAISFVIARALLIWFGLRPGRTIAMVSGFVILICGVLAFQVNSMVGTEFGDERLAQWFGPTFLDRLTAFVTPIGRLAFGQPLETLGLFAGALGTFFAMGAFFWDRFASDAAMLAGQAQHVQRTTKEAKVTFARGIFVTTILKEWRSMLRDPFVLIQVATPLVSLIPLAVVLWSMNGPNSRMDESLLVPIMGALLVMFGGQITGTLAWTAASIEEAGDLLLSSPSDGGQLFWSKALATAIPSFVFLALAMGVIALSNPNTAIMGLAIGTVGLCCCGAVEFLRPRPARRAKMTQRPDRSILSVIMGSGFSILWAATTGIAMSPLGFWALIPMSVGLLAVAFVWATAPKSVVWMAKAPKVGSAGGPWKA